MAAINRTTLLKQWYFERLKGMQCEITTLLSSPAKYLDAALTGEPTSGIELYERYDKLRDGLRSEFPEFTKVLSTRNYSTTRDGSLLRSDLKRLEREVEMLLSLFEA